MTPHCGAITPPAVEYGFAIVQKADSSSSLFDDLDAALQSGSSERRVAMLRQVTDLFLTEANRLNEEQIGVFYGLLTDLLELTSNIKEPVLRNTPLAKELESLGKSVDSAWVLRAIAGFDELYAGARRNLNRQLGLDALAASLAPDASRDSNARL